MDALLDFLTRRRLMIALVTLVGLVAFFKFTATSDEVDVYVLSCGELSGDGKCVTGWRLQSTVTYFVSVKDQRVLSRTSGSFSEGALQELHNCIVLDNENWSCDLSSDGATVFVERGRFGINRNYLRRMSALEIYEDAERLNQIERSTRFLSAWEYRIEAIADWFQ